jgi:hypothetical protein
LEEQAMTTAVQTGRLSVLIGGGTPEPVDLEEASRHSGTITDVLLRHYVRDDDLVAELTTDGAVVEQRARRSDGSAAESAMSGRESWESLIRRVEQGETVTVGIAQRHIGGAQ